jgi:sec-independent protein translocase protein TatB
MFDIGFQELLLIGVLSLLIMGPERLPGAVRTTTLWFSRLRRSFQQIKTEIEREVGIDDIKQKVHNESIMKDLEKTKQDFQQSIQHSADSIKPELDQLHNDISNITEPTKTADKENNSISNNSDEHLHEPSNHK